MNKSPTFHMWKNYWGLLHQEKFANSTLSVYGFETETQSAKNEYHFTQAKSLFGFVHSGQVSLTSKSLRWTIQEGQWFCVSGQDTEINLAPASRLYVVSDDQHQALTSMGGPVEAEGRLHYIDGCTDTLLYSPPVQGDPCLNLLHFPSSVNQSMHTHPSSRIGIVSAGSGACTTPDKEIPLVSGMIFVLPKDTPHRFLTRENTLDVVTFHPDSDWGPTHEKHPMINRTWLVE